MGILGGVVPAAMDALPWPKSMRWGTTDARWVRPLTTFSPYSKAVRSHRLSSSFETSTLSLNPTSETRLQSDALNKTLGHRFLAPATFAVIDFDDYRAKLRAAKVILDQDERRRLIASRSGAAGGGGRVGCARRSGAARRGDRARRMAGRPSRPHRRGVHGCAAGGADHRDADAPEVFRTDDAGRQSWRRGSSSSPTPRPPTAVPPSSPATNACCAPGWRTPNTSGTRTASARWKVACRS